MKCSFNLPLDLLIILKELSLNSLIMDFLKSVLFDLNMSNIIFSVLIANLLSKVNLLLQQQDPHK